MFCHIKGTRAYKAAERVCLSASAFNALLAMALAHGEYCVNARSAQFGRLAKRI